MIQITDKHDCCGCSACVQVCPKQCISFEEDEQGFRYPLVNKELCIDCGLCEKVCPFLNQNGPRKPLKVFAAINSNEEVRMASSSGGIFTMLAESIIEEEGVVFGACYDKNWEVKHDYTETKEGLKAFRGSKYVQSVVGETYKQARDFLNQGRKVLYSGTTCQIAGLKHFLRKDYDNLLAVDVICHGVPSPLVWREYLKSVRAYPKDAVEKNKSLSALKDEREITSISFRDKSTGWKKYSFVIRGTSESTSNLTSILPSDNNIVLLHETFDKNFYMQVFLKNLCLRPSCSNCPAKGGKSGSDLTIADFWGIENYHPDWDDDKGTSIILVNTEKGENTLSNIACKLKETSYDFASRGNPSIENSYKETRYIDLFWGLFIKKGITESYKVLNMMKPSFPKKAYNLLMKYFGTLANKFLK